MGTNKEKGDLKMRTLGFYPIFSAMITVILILAICIMNMHLLAKHKSSYVTILIHIVSGFAVFSLIFHMLSAAVFVHPLSKLYFWISQKSFFLGIGTVVVGTILAIFLGKKYRLRNLPNSIPDALEKLEDVVFVVDRDGIILHINHPDTYHSMFGDIATIDELYSFMENHCSQWDGLQKLDSVSGTQICELYLDCIKTNIVFKISPIILDGNHLGYTAVLENVTSIREIEKKLEIQNETLVLTNEKLSKYILAEGALEGEQERLKILSQVQETLVRDIENALPCLDEIKQHRMLDGSYQIAMIEFAKQLRQIYQKVRNTVGQIGGKEVKE